MAEVVAAGSFAGFRPAALGFLRDLAAHQDRAWFQEHRAVYEREVLAPLRALVADLATDLPRRGIPLTADPLKAIFRIYRDVRFSRDKSPYKTHAGAVLSRDGQKDAFGLLYIHIDPQGSFSAAGFWQPEPRALEALRIAMLEEPQRLLDTLAAVQDTGCELLREDALTRLPRGFEHAAGTPVAEHVKLRHLIVRRSIAARELKGAGLAASLADFAAAALPLLRFGWDAVEAS
jgi:uncharacterized protein (TIGR02453 family)